MNENLATKTDQPLLQPTPDLLTAVNAWSSSFIRPTVPGHILDNSKNIGVIDEGAKLLTARFMYGERRGKLSEQPHDGGDTRKITSLSSESLWLYDSAKPQTPDGFTESKQPAFVIGTGRVKKCDTCRGHGKVTCSTCKGKIRWTERSGDSVVEKICSCGDGKQMCKNCTGFGQMEDIIICDTNFKVTSSSDQEYTGDVPKAELAKTTGRTLFDEAVEYPKDILKQMLTGGIDATEFTELQRVVRGNVHELVHSKLANYDGNLDMVTDLIDDFFKKMPNPADANKLFEYEILPVRLQVKVEDAPVSQVNYTFKDKAYKLWLYGNEKKVFAHEKPFAFTPRLGAWIVLAAGLISTIVYYAR